MQKGIQGLTKNNGKKYLENGITLRVSDIGELILPRVAFKGLPPRLSDIDEPNVPCEGFFETDWQV